MSGALIPLLAAIAAQEEEAKRKRFLEPFRRADATAPERAIAFAPGAKDRRLFAEYRRGGVIVEGEAGRFWYDDEARRAAGRRTLKQALAAVVGLGGIALAAITLTK